VYVFDEQTRNTHFYARSLSFGRVRERGFNYGFGKCVAENLGFAQKQFPLVQAQTWQHVYVQSFETGKRNNKSGEPYSRVTKWHAG
jgi:hypothetical protein